MWFGVTRLRCLADVQGTGRVYSEEKINVELPGRRGGVGGRKTSVKVHGCSGGGHAEG